MQQTTFIRTEVNISRKKQVAYWICWVFSLIGGFIFMYRMIFDVTHIKSVMDIWLPLNICMYMAILAIMLERRQVITPRQIKHNRQVVNNGYLILVLLSICNAVLIVIACFKEH